MNIVRYTKINISQLRLTIFCYVIVENNSLVFINRINRKTRRKIGNPMVLSLLSNRLNNRKTIAESETLLKQWRFDYQEVIEDLIEEGYFE